MMSKFGDYLKNYKQGKHIQQEKASTAHLAPPTPSYSPLWSQIQEYNQLKTDANSKPTTSENDSIRSENLQDTSRPERSLGILFIIIDEMPNELLWRLWLSENSSDVSNMRVWIHAKYPERVKSSWVKERLVKSFHLLPDWGSLDLTRVMLGLLDEVSDNSLCTLHTVQRLLLGNQRSSRNSKICICLRIVYSDDIIPERYECFLPSQ